MNKQNILLIEDEPSISDTLRYALETEGFRVIVCASVKEGREKLEKEKVDALVLDIGLPDQSGFEFCKEIRKSSSLPILFLTARNSEIDKVVGLEIGADDYVTKPFSPREVVARVKAILRRQKITPGSETNPTKTLIHSHFQIDESKKQISYFEQNLELTRYEYKLLKLLIQKAGQVFSRDQLMDLVWDSAESSFDRTVDAHVKSLRSKLKKIKNGLDPIETHRGFGYSLKEIIT